MRNLYNVECAARTLLYLDLRIFLLHALQLPLLFFPRTSIRYIRDIRPYESVAELPSKTASAF